MTKPPEEKLFENIIDNLGKPKVKPKVKAKLYENYVNLKHVWILAALWHFMCTQPRLHVWILAVRASLMQAHAGVKKRYTTVV